MIWVIVVALSLVAFAATFAAERALIRRTARELRGVLAVAHEVDWIQTRLSEHPALDHEFYEASRLAFEQLGFSLLSDVELVSLTRASPHRRTLARLMSSDDGTITIGIYHLKTHGLRGVMAGLLGVPEHRVLEATTEMDDGCFITTSTTASSAWQECHPRVRRDLLPERTPPRSLFQRHLENVGIHLRAHSKTSSVALRSLDDVMASVRHLMALQKAHRVSLGGKPTSAELRAITRGAPVDYPDRLAEEMERQRNEE